MGTTLQVCKVCYDWLVFCSLLQMPLSLFPNNHIAFQLDENCLVPLLFVHAIPPRKLSISQPMPAYVRGLSLDITFSEKLFLTMQKQFETCFYVILCPILPFSFHSIAFFILQVCLPHKANSAVRTGNVPDAQTIVPVFTMCLVHRGCSVNIY